MKRLSTALVFAGLMGICAPGYATTILYNPAGILSGYKASNSTAFSSALETALGGTSTEIANFENLAQVMAADVVFVNIRGAVSSLSAAEQSNLVAFAATGKPLFMLGENYLNFGSWNASILSPFGGVNYAYQANTIGAVVRVNNHPLTFNLEVLPDVNNPGTISVGGYPLWTSTYAWNPYAVGALFGAANNVFILLETGPLNNIQLGTNMGGWAKDTLLALPEPTSAVLLMISGAGWLVRRRRA